LGLLDDQVMLLSQPGVLGLKLRHPLVHCLHRTRYPVDEIVDFVLVVSGGEAAGLVKGDGLQLGGRQRAMRSCQRVVPSPGSSLTPRRRRIAQFTLIET
jgi:hypothetical protein